MRRACSRGLRDERRGKAGTFISFFYFFQFFLFNRTNAGGALIISVLSLSSSFVSSLLFWVVRVFDLIPIHNNVLPFSSLPWVFEQGLSLWRRSRTQRRHYSHKYSQPKGGGERNIIITVCFRICSDSRLFIPLTAYTRVGVFFSLFPNSLLLRLF